MAQAFDALRSAGGEDAAQLEAARNALRGIDGVLLPSGETVEVTPLLDGIDDPEDAAARLQLVVDQLTLAENDRPSERLGLLREILARPALAPRPRGLWQRFVDWLSEQLRRIWGEPAEGSATGDLLAQVMAYGLAIVGGVLALIFLSTWLAGLLRNSAADADGRPRRARPGEGPATATDAREQATALARARDYRGSVRLLYLALLLQIEEQGLVRRDRSLTDRELLERVAPAAPDVGERLEPVVGTFDRVWYGVRQPDEETYLRYREDVEAAAERIGARPKDE